MTILEILKIIAAVATILTGLFAMVRPKSIEGFTGLTAPGSRGITEFRAVFGGFFIGLGAAPLFLGTPAYIMLGIAYLSVAVVRGFSMIFDRSVVQSNIISIVTEIVLGVLLVL